MIQADHKLVNFLGTVIWGDLADFTLYRCKGRLIMFPKTRPEKPPSILQTYQRQKFTAAYQQWNALTPDQRAAWETATRRLSLCMHGYDLWMHWQLTQDTSAIRTIERQTGLTLLP